MRPFTYSVLFVLSANIFLAEAVLAEDWPMYGKDLQHSFSNPNTKINTTNVSALKPAWRYDTQDAVTASPTVVDNVVYVGSWDGFFYALNAQSGALIWKYKVDCQNAVVPVPLHCLASGEIAPDRTFSDGGLITSSAAVDDHKVYFAAGRTVYSLNAKDGTLRWKRVICGNPEDANCLSDTEDRTRIFSSPAVYHDVVFVGHSNEKVGYRGGFEAIDANTGQLRWHFEVDPVFNSFGQPIGGLNRGCGNVWSSAAVDQREGLVFFGTADCQFGASPPYHEAVIALKAMTGKLQWVFRPRDADKCDYDFGASPNIINLNDRKYLGIGGKDGTYYVLDRVTSHPNERLIWKTNVVFGGNSGGFYGGAAFDGTHLFSATALGDFSVDGSVCDPANPNDLPIQEPSMHAFDAMTGQILWQQNQNQSFAATTLANGVIFSSFTFPGLPPDFIPVHELLARDARNGQLLAHFPLPGNAFSGATPVGKMVFVGSGNTNDGQGSAVNAFKLPD